MSNKPNLRNATVGIRRRNSKPWKIPFFRTTCSFPGCDQLAKHPIGGQKFCDQHVALAQGARVASQKPKARS